MPEHTHAFRDWPFEAEVTTPAYCTSKVVRQGFPVLQVSHDSDGDWQFLDATTEKPGDCALLCLGCVLERDPTLAQISDLPRGWGAWRSAVGAPWERWEKPTCEDEDKDEDAGDRKALADIERHGLHVINVMEDGDLPPFSYSIGVEQSLGMPELIVIGLRHEVAQAAINECYEQMKAGTLIAPGARVVGLLGGGFTCLIGEVRAEHQKEYLGWARWLYKETPFRAWQIIFPNTSGVFPWEAEANEWFRNRQPLLGPIAGVATGLHGLSA